MEIFVSYKEKKKRLSVTELEMIRSNNLKRIVKEDRLERIVREDRLERIVKEDKTASSLTRNWDFIVQNKDWAELVIIGIYYLNTYNKPLIKLKFIILGFFLNNKPLLF